MKWLAERYLKIRGWKFIGSLPEIDKLIVIGAPHTSNWDFVIYLAAISHWNFRPRYLGKHTLFQGPFGWLFRRWGGIPVDRRQQGGMIGQVAQTFAENETIALVLAPEGTREAAPEWKSGFLAIAEAVDAPIVPARVNFEKKEIVLGDPISHHGDTTSTMDAIREFFADAVGKNAEGKGPIRVKEESA